ncbi:MAG TPA: MBL fold metallo-hydrolase [Solirubrobacteraceae bacterium]|nr:MBL fold metallo-hydrolase [Solirubrobacteraceae bacterium]
MTGVEPAVQPDGVHAGIHAIAVQTPFLVGRVNCYLIEDRPLTLVDTGPNWGRSLDELETGLDALSHRIEDLELIVLTHQHMDHLGLLEILQRRSGADVAAFHQLGPYLSGFSASATADDEFAMEIMRQNGVPADLATALSSVSASFRAFGSSGELTRPLRDGDELRFADRTLRALHRPGHSPSDTVFLDEERRMLIAGDHLLAHISSNPLISRPLTGETGGKRPRALLMYIESMRRTRELDLDLVLTGHGEPVTEHVALIDERLRMHDRRAAKLLGMLSPEPLTAYELALGMWGNVAVTQAFLTISEVLGHMDLLVEREQVIERDDGSVTRFEAVTAATLDQ